jgi:hypothetical protein
VSPPPFEETAQMLTQAIHRPVERLVERIRSRSGRATAAPSGTWSRTAGPVRSRCRRDRERTQPPRAPLTAANDSVRIVSSRARPTSMASTARLVPKNFRWHRPRRPACRAQWRPDRRRSGSRHSNPIPR